MKRNNKKGFTIVELVIVIAVIAILSAVLIPTFTGIVDKAEATADLQNARNAYTEYLVDHPTAEIEYVKQNNKFYAVDDFDGVPATSVDNDVVYLDASSGELDHNEACAEGTTHDHLCDVCGTTVTCTPAEGETCPLASN